MEITQRQLRDILYEIIEEDAEDTDNVKFNAVDIIVYLLMRNEQKQRSLINRIIAKVSKDTTLNIKD